MAKRLRCYLRLHRWETRRAEGGGMYKECRDCGKFGEIEPPPPPLANLGA
jgi:hypothetical protein